MEDVLAVYTRPHDPDRPVACVPGRDFKATARGNAGADPDPPNRDVRPVAMTRQARSERHRKLLHQRLRRSKGRATSKSPNAIPRWTTTSSRPGRCPFRQRQDHRSGPGPTSTARRHSTKPFLPPKPSAWSIMFTPDYTPKHGSGSIRGIRTRCRACPSASTAGSHKQTLIEEVAAGKSKRQQRQQNQSQLALQHPTLVPNSETSPRPE